MGTVSWMRHRTGGNESPGPGILPSALGILRTGIALSVPESTLPLGSVFHRTLLHKAAVTEIGLMTGEI